ncbi:hypothetical protein [Campylobacter lanienae]|uniref:hypothetical protein n=1 Tax=Campylobacter lanienae TaxID=75658 RepID=UPI00191C8D57|nr:hypothetical protein [Campylobacter lanienae]
MPCGVKWGTPRSGALGGSRECNSLPQTATLLPCGVKIVCYFRRGFATPLKVGKNGYPYKNPWRKPPIERLLQGVRGLLRGKG